MKKLYSLLLCLIGLNIVAFDAQSQTKTDADAVVANSTDFLQVNAAVDLDPSTYCYLSTSVGVLNTSFLTFSYPQLGHAGDIIAFDVQGTGGALSASLLDNVTVRVYNDLGVNVATATGSSILNLDLSLTASDVYSLRYMTDFNETYNIKTVTLEFNDLLTIQLLDEFRVYGSWLQTPCPPVYATSVNAYANNVLTGYVANPTNSVTASTSDFSTMNVLVAIPPITNTAYLELNFATKGIAGEYVAFTIGEASTVLSLSLLQSLTVEVYNSLGGLVATKNNFTLADLKLLAGSTDEYYLGFITPDGSYDIAKMKLTMNGISVLNSLKVYNAMHFKQQPFTVNLESATTEFCTGSTVTLTAQAPAGTTLLWSNGGTTNSIDVSTAGDYSFIATDSEGCTSSSSTITLTALPTPTVSITNGATASFCSNVDVTLSSSPSVGATVLWSNGATTNNTTVNVAGDYTVTATAPNGCKASALVSVSSITAPEVNTTIEQVKCNGNNNGSISLTPISMTANYTYTWNTTANVASINSLSPGTYSVDIVDQTTLCNMHYDYVITEPEPLSLTGETSKETCVNNDGAITFMPEGGTAPYYYSISDISNDAWTGLVAGTYSVTVTDNNMCQVTESFNVAKSNCSSLDIHNVITPNNDGLNEVMIVEGIENYPNSSLEVFDKWGDVVYMSDHYDNSWSGRNKNDTGTLPSGTYYYILKLNAKQVPNGKNDYTGFVMIQ